MLRCVGFSAGEKEPLDREFSYGVDVVGTAFRRRKPFGYSRPEAKSGGILRFENFPENQVLVCFSCPLNWPTVQDWPAGVLTLAVNDERRGPNEPEPEAGPLDSWVREPKKGELLSAAIIGLWLEQRTSLCPEAV